MHSLRRSSGRFAPATQSQRTRGPLIGFALCVLVLPLAMSAARNRVSDTMVRATMSPLAVRLADSSLVTLQPGSALRYFPRTPTRRVWLSGRAEVVVAPGAPFAVWTETAVLRTSGATLVVRTAGLESTFVAVRAGSVRLRAMNEDNDPAYPAVTANAGETAVAAKMVGARILPRPQ